MKRLFRRLQWNVGVAVNAQPADFLSENFAPTVRWMAPPKYGTFLADPFVFEYDGRAAVLCERFEYFRGKGNIAALEIIGNELVDWGTAIDSPFHLSYPCVVEYEGEVYCIPEARESGALHAYRLTAFPNGWTYHARIMDEAVVDPTVFEWNGSWWMFGTLRPQENRALNAWHAPTPLGPWTPHPRNPLRTDPSSARPAGRPFVSSGRLLRPAQDCTGHYGAAIMLNEIEDLSQARFVETPLKRIAPMPPYALGMHTLNASAHYCVVDGRRDVFALDKVVSSALRRSHEAAVARKMRAETRSVC